MNLDELVQFAENSQLVRVLLYPAIMVRRMGWSLRESIRDRVLDNLSALLDGDPVIKVDEFHGKFIISSRSDIFRQAIKNKGYEPRLARCCLDNIPRHRDVIDVGANIGFYTVLFGKELPGKKVLAIEPTPGALSLLYQNLELNHVREAVIVFEGVASNCAGSVEMHTILGKEEYSSLGSMDHPKITGDSWSTIKVQSKTVDQLVAEHSLDPGFIKIDVEGMEHLVLQGMHKVLTENRPVLLSEFSPALLKKNGSSAGEIINLLHSYDYDVVDPFYSRMKPGQRRFGEILCRPRR